MESFEIAQGEFVYELVEISWSLEYDFSQMPHAMHVADEGELPGQKEARSEIEYDVDGIPMGGSMEEIRVRQSKIKDFFEQWSNNNADRKVFNANLGEYILVRQISVIEATEHSAKGYLSTKAVLRLEEVLSQAHEQTQSRPKPNDKNQKKFDKFIILTHRLEGIGLVKLTVGVRNRTHDKIQYGISSYDPQKPLVDPMLQINTKGANKKKARHKK